MRWPVSKRHFTVVLVIQHKMINPASMGEKKIQHQLTKAQIQLTYKIYSEQAENLLFHSKLFLDLSGHCAKFTYFRFQLEVVIFKHK